MNSVAPTPTPTPITSQTHTNNLNPSLLEADFAVGIIMVILGALCFIFVVYFDYKNFRNNVYNKYSLILILLSLVIIISGVFLILTSKNINIYIKIQQNSVSPIDIEYGVTYIVLTALLLFLLFVMSYYTKGNLSILFYSAYSIVLGFIATLMINGIKYIFSGES